MEIKSYTKLVRILALPNQHGLERIGVTMMTLLMLITAISFHISSNQNIFNAFSQGLGIEVSPVFFVAISLLGALSYPFQLLNWFRHKGAFTKRLIWSLGASPIIIYSIPVGHYFNVLRMQGMNVSGFTIVSYFAIYFLISFAGACLHRE